MASGPLPKRVTCIVCGAPQGVPCRDPITKAPLNKVHGPRAAQAQVWYETPSPDGLTPKRRDEMVQTLQDSGLRRGEVGKAMEKITKAEDSEAEFSKYSR